MIILPVEKRLNWNNPPIILSIIILMNVMIFFFYQLNDDEKIDEALDIYYEQGLDKIEWPLYQQYTKQNEKDDVQEQLQELEELYGIDFNQYSEDNPYNDFIITLLLQDKDFPVYLESHPELFEDELDYNLWLQSRAQVDLWMQRSSSARFALTPSERHWFTFISYQFMHGGLMHLLGNLFFLIVCGFAVEAAIGHWRFLLFYLLGGIAGGAGHVLLDPQSTIPLVGASGSISAVMAMYLGVFRLKQIEFFYWFYVIVGYFRAPALLILPVYMGKEIYSYMSAGGDNVAYMAHLGGFIAGGVLILALYLINKNLLDHEYIEEDSSIDPEQAQQASILNALEKLHFKQALNLLNEAITTADKKGKYFASNLILKAKLMSLLNDNNTNSFIIDQVLTQKVSDTKLLEEHAKLWQQIQHPKIDQSLQLQLGLKFCSLDKIKTSETIFQNLSKQNVNSPKMAILAGRIAYYYTQHNNTKQAEHYQSIADNLNNTI